MLAGGADVTSVVNHWPQNLFEVVAELHVEEPPLNDILNIIWILFPINAWTNKIIIIIIIIMIIIMITGYAYIVFCT